LPKSNFSKCASSKQENKVIKIQTFQEWRIGKRTGQLENYQPALFFSKIGSRPRLPDFSWYKYQNGKKLNHKFYQMDLKYTKWTKNIPNGLKIYQIDRKMTVKYT
jgi:hypothetical protein